MKEGMEIVLIEDNDEDAARLLKFLRTNVTNSVRLIQDGAAAAEFLLFETDSIPKLILLDLVLPSVDGIELFNMIRLEPKERKLFVIFLVSSFKTKDYLDSIGLHPDGYLKKPTDEVIPVRLDS
jgi:CheY-like chemotaxis protein